MILTKKQIRDKVKAYCESVAIDYSTVGAFSTFPLITMGGQAPPAPDQLYIGRVIAKGGVTLKHHGNYNQVFTETDKVITVENIACAGFECANYVTNYSWFEGYYLTFAPGALPCVRS